MSRVPFLLATRSAGKLRELRPLFAEAGLPVIDLVEAGIAEAPDEDAVEAHDTFEANALAKARYFHRRSGLPALADDSGLEVRALGGAPGVRSKRWSGRADLTGVALDAANNRRLLDAMAGLPDRRARFVCVAAMADGTRELHARGVVEGTIGLEARGEGGFGYDPYFVPVEGDGRSFAEMGRAEKARVSHRARAFAALVRLLGELPTRD